MQCSSAVALINPDIEDPFFDSLARGVEDVARQAKPCVVPCNIEQRRATPSNSEEDVARSAVATLGSPSPSG